MKYDQEYLNQQEYTWNPPEFGSQSPEVFFTSEYTRADNEILGNREFGKEQLEQERRLKSEQENPADTRRPEPKARTRNSRETRNNTLENSRKGYRGAQNMAQAGGAAGGGAASAGASIAQAGVQMVTMVAATAVVVTSAAVASEGAFLPELNKVAVEMMAELNTPMISAEPGLDFAETVMQFFNSDVSDSDFTVEADLGMQLDNSGVAGGSDGGNAGGGLDAMAALAAEQAPEEQAESEAAEEEAAEQTVEQEDAQAAAVKGDEKQLLSDEALVEEAPETEVPEAVPETEAEKQPEKVPDEAQNAEKPQNNTQKPNENTGAGSGDSEHEENGSAGNDSGSGSNPGGGSGESAGGAGNSGSHGGSNGNTGGDTEKPEQPDGDNGSGGDGGSSGGSGGSSGGGGGSDVHTHNFVWTTVKEPTCTQAGEAQGRCTDCGESRTKQLAAKGHQKVSFGTAHPASCVATGQTTGSRCSICGEILAAQQSIPKLNHTSNYRVTVTKEASCTETGLRDVYCPICRIDIRKNEVVAMTAHKPVPLGEEIKPSCMATGLTAGSKCEVCGTALSEQEIIPKLAHENSYKETVTKEASCAETGLRDVYCPICRLDVKTGEVIPKTDHSSVWEEDVQEPGCTEDGERKIYCPTCEIEVGRETIPALGHKEELLGGYPASCKNTGLTDGKVCTVCKEVLVEQQEIPVNPEAHGDKLLYSPSKDSRKDDVHEVSCLDCGKTYLEAHDWGDWYEVKTASARFVGTGTNERKCKKCGHTMKSEMEAGACKYHIDTDKDEVCDRCNTAKPVIEIEIKVEPNELNRLQRTIWMDGVNSPGIVISTGVIYEFQYSSDGVTWGMAPDKNLMTTPGYYRYYLGGIIQKWKDWDVVSESYYFDGVKAADELIPEQTLPLSPEETVKPEQDAEQPEYPLASGSEVVRKKRGERK